MRDIVNIPVTLCHLYTNYGTHLSDNSLVDLNYGTYLGVLYIRLSMSPRG